MTREQIKKRCEYWQWKLGLINWQFDIKFVKYTKAEDRLDLVAQISCNSAYKNGTLEFNEEYLDEVNDETIIHEFIHSLQQQLLGYIRENTHELKSRKSFLSWVDFFKEQMASEIARIILRYEENRQGAKVRYTKGSDIKKNRRTKSKPKSKNKRPGAKGKVH